jgi:glycosyltransferase involved in cell wall biosynthesis
MNRTKLLHVLPALTIGGVEVGIYRSCQELIQTMDYQVFSVKNRGSLPVPRLSWFDLLNCALRPKNTPDVVVSSLWLGHLVGLPLALVFGAKWIPFFHAARSEGFLRDFILRSAAHLSKYAFFDSEATRAYYGTHSRSSSQVIPYRFRSTPSSGPPQGKRHYDCVFVGRLSSEKRTDLLITYLTHLKSLDTGIRSLVILSTSDEGFDEFKRQLASNSVVAEVRANVDPMEVVSLLGMSSLYLGFSDYEGFSMATVDAMTCGCVPVVRPVGEISSYVDDRCGIAVKDTSSDGLKLTAIRSLALLRDADTWQAYSEQASQRVTRYGLYTEAFIEGVHCVQRSS